MFDLAKIFQMPFLTQSSISTWDTGLYPLARFSAYSPHDNKFWAAKMCVQTLGWIDAQIYVMWKV